MYIVTQLKEHCSDAEQVVYYCETLEEAVAVAQDIANETGTVMQILQLITTISCEEPYEEDVCQRFKDEQAVRR